MTEFYIAPGRKKMSTKIGGTVRGSMSKASNSMYMDDFSPSPKNVGMKRKITKSSTTHVRGGRNFMTTSTETINVQTYLDQNAVDGAALPEVPEVALAKPKIKKSGSAINKYPQDSYLKQPLSEIVQESNESAFA